MSHKGLTVKVCKRCGAVGGSATGFAAWCVGSQREHDAVDAEYLPAADLEQLREALGELVAETERFAWGHAPSPRKHGLDAALSHARDLLDPK